MNFTADSVVAWRLAAQLLQQSDPYTVEQIVARLGGVQSQDLAGAKWSIGVRMPHGTDREVEKALADRRIVRTWAFRGTLHFLAAADVSWVSALLSPLVVAANQKRSRELELDEKTFSRTNQLIRAALLKNRRPHSRTEICSLLEREGISTTGQRAPYLLQRAALDGSICLGPNRGRETTYELFSERVDSPSPSGGNRALTVLAERYFTGHGPATIRDFCWWSGLPVSVAREALREAASLQRITVDGVEMWAGQVRPALIRQSAHLLPPFDEYMLGYRDRRSALDPQFKKRVNAGGGMLRPVIIVNGKVLGVWKRAKKKNRISISTEPFHVISDSEYQAIVGAAQRFGRFHETAVELM